MVERDQHNGPGMGDQQTRPDQQTGPGTKLSSSQAGLVMNGLRGRHRSWRYGRALLWTSHSIPAPTQSDHDRDTRGRRRSNHHSRHSSLTPTLGWATQVSLDARGVPNAPASFHRRYWSNTARENHCIEPRHSTAKRRTYTIS